MTQRFRHDGNDHLKPQLPRLDAADCRYSSFSSPHRPDDALLVGAAEETTFPFEGRQGEVTGGIARNLPEGEGKLEFTIKDCKITGEDTLKNGQKIKPIFMRFS